MEGVGADPCVCPVPVNNRPVECVNNHPSLNSSAKPPLAGCWAPAHQIRRCAKPPINVSQVVVITINHPIGEIEKKLESLDSV